MRTQIVLIAVLATLLQVQAGPALFSKPSGGLFGGLLGKKDADVDLAQAKADEINDAVVEAAEEAKKSSGSFLQNTMDSIKDKADGLKSTVTDTVSNIQEGAKNAVTQGQETIAAQIEKAQEVASSITSKVQEVQSGVQEQITTVVDKTGVKEQISEAVEKAQEVQAGIKDNITGALSGAVEAVQGVQAEVKEQISGAVEAAQGVQSGIRDRITGAVNGAVAKAGEIREAIAGAIDNVVEVVAPVTLWGRIVGFFTGFMRPSAKDINAAINENIESTAATLSSISNGLPTLESAGILKPPTIAVA